MDMKRIHQNFEDKNTYKPDFFRLNKLSDKKRYEDLLTADIHITVYDEIDGQIRELVKCQNPHIRIKDEDYPKLVAQHFNGVPVDEYGVWVYYPWTGRLIHSLDEAEFIEVRTNRNKYKLTTEEQNFLSGKKIGIIGLSVGQSIALTIAMERICGELRLADFDTAELSNLNRIRTGIHNLGLKKTIIAAREIAEIDPFLNVKIFSDGLHKDNMEEFFSEGGKLDLLVEVCDGLDIKIQSRFKAREMGIPVVMDTNDRGMMDVERFDLEPERPILHGLAGDLNPDNIKDLTNEQKIPYIFKMVGVDTLSTRLKASMIEVSQSINTWPQLASSVVLGGALTTDVARRILLNQYHDSGRYYIDIDELIADKESANANGVNGAGTPIDEEGLIEQYFSTHNANGGEEILFDELNELIAAGNKAPSYKDKKYLSFRFVRNTLFVFSVDHRYGWDNQGIGAMMSVGTALENIHLQASVLKLKDNVQLFPLKAENKLIAAIVFKKVQSVDDHDLTLANNINSLSTELKSVPVEPLPLDFLNNLQYFVNQAENVQVLNVDKQEEIGSIARIVGAVHRLQLLDQEGHSEFYDNIIWDGDIENVRHVKRLGFSDGEIAGYSVAKDWKAMSLLAKWDKGNVFRLMATFKATMSSAMLLLVTRNDDAVTYIETGRLLERIWLYCAGFGIAVEPIIEPAILFNKLKRESAIQNNKGKEIEAIKDDLFKIFPLVKEYGHETQVVLLKLALPAKAKQ